MYNYSSMGCIQFKLLPRTLETQLTTVMVRTVLKICMLFTPLIVNFISDEGRQCFYCFLS